MDWSKLNRLHYAQIGKIAASWSGAMPKSRRLRLSPRAARPRQPEHHLLVTLIDSAIEAGLFPSEAELLLRCTRS
jgi:hypothetical protein